MTIPEVTRPRSRVRPCLGVAALAPAISLLVSRVLSGTVGTAGWSGRLPVGLHTYLPLADVVNVRWLEAASVLLAMVGLWLLAGATRQRDSGRGPAGTIVRLGASVAATQVLFYIAQAAVVAQVQGLPDAGPAVLAAVALPLLVVAVLVTLAAGGAVVLYAPAPVTVARWTPAVTAIAATGVVRVASRPQQLRTPRRGPPLLLLI